MLNYYFLSIPKLYFSKFEIYTYATASFSGIKEFIQQAIVCDYSRTKTNLVWTLSLLSNRILSMESSTISILRLHARNLRQRAPEIRLAYNRDILYAEHRSTTSTTFKCSPEQQHCIIDLSYHCRPPSTTC